MSDDESSPQSSSARIRQKKVDRSCDLCRRRKIRCDGAGTPTASCTHCRSIDSPCTYLLPTKKRGPKNKQLEELKRQIAVLESKLRTLSICSLCSQPLRNDGSVFQQGTPGSDSTVSDDVHPEEDEDDEELASELNRISVDTKFFGANSGFALANEAIAVKEKYTGQQSLNNSRRPLFWQVLPWEKETFEQQVQFVYPEPDLLYSLLHLYFSCVHPTLPLLHRPSFERSVSEGMHHRDPQFGSLLLSVMAVASRFSDDPRVFVDGHSTLSSGWRFISQVPVVRKWFEPNIHEVQFYFLMTLYSIGTSRPQAAWIYLGNGIRFLQQRGEHRRKRDLQDTDKEKETWSRAFWSFVCLDRMVCAYIGRPAGLHVEDYDADPLLQVDDEYWDTGFNQPPDRPAYSAFMIRYVQLCEILGDAMRKLYGSKKSKTLQGWNGRDWEQRAVAQLDSEMNKIFDSLPPHLHWDPDNSPRDAFYDQAFVLNVTYYFTQIVVHRPYIQKLSALAAPSLSICASAARSILHAADSWIKRQQRLPMQFVISPIFVASVILIMNTFGKPAGALVDKDKALVAKGMDIAKFAETRLHPQGRLWEMLKRLQSSDGPLSKQRPSNNTSTQAPSPPFKAQGASHQSTSHSRPYTPAQYGDMGRARSSPTVSPVSSEMYPSPPEGQPLEGVASLPPTQRWHDTSGTNLGDTRPSVPNQPYDLQPGMSIEELLAQTAHMESIVSPPVGHEYIQQMHASYVQEDDMNIDDADLVMWNSVPSNISDVAQWGMYMQRNASASPPSHFGRSYQQ
ncbi:fungal-specific transcription factor domain-containing protein [Mycena amicta]|nr:fungal-specific transcription factor domain-containing protein [Mycena amicta]